MTALTLYVGSKNYSSWSFRPWLALRHAGVAFEEVVIVLDQPDTAAQIAKVSAAGRVPVLQDGALMVWDSLAILEYVAERFPESALWPADASARAVARSVSAEMHSGFAELRKHLPMNFRARKARSESTPAVDADIARVQRLWADCRKRFGAGGPFLFGRFSAADCMYAPVVSRFVTYGVPLDDTAAAYAAQMQSLPAWKAWAAASAAEPPVKRYEV